MKFGRPKKLSDQAEADFAGDVIFNELTNKELTGLLLEACDADWDRVDRVEDRKGHDLRYSVDISKISKELGYTPQVDFKAGLAATVDWYRNYLQSSTKV